MELNRLARQAHVEASDKLHHPVLSDHSLMRHGKDFGSQCGCLCVGKNCTVLSDFLAFTQVSKSRARPVPRRHKLPHKHKKRPNSFDFCV